MAESPDNKELEANVVDAMDRFLTGATPEMNEKEMIPYVFANDKRNPAPFGLLNMIYAGCFTNTLGVMVAKDKETDKEVTLLIGLAAQEGTNEPSIYPVAVIIGENDVPRYLPPDGKGGYIELERSQPAG